MIRDLSGAMLKLPVIRADCINADRPCPHTECRHHLPGGACVLDAVDAHPGGIRDEDIAALLDCDVRTVREIGYGAEAEMRRRLQR